MDQQRSISSRIEPPHAAFRSSFYVRAAGIAVYIRFGGLPWIGAMLSGLKPAVVGLVIAATIRVARRSLDTALQRTVRLARLPP